MKTTTMKMKMYLLFGILGVPLSNNPFHKGILGIQTTGTQTNN